jgi:hypothetical protein
MLACAVCKCKRAGAGMCCVQEAGAGMCSVQENRCRHVLCSSEQVPACAVCKMTSAGMCCVKKRQVPACARGQVLETKLRTIQ